MSTELKEPPKVERKSAAELFREGAGYTKQDNGQIVPIKEEAKAPETAPAPEKVEATKPPVEVTETKPALDPKLIEGVNKVTAPKSDDKETNLANLRKIVEEREKKIKELEEKSKAYPVDYEEIKKNYELVNTELTKVKLEATPEFKKKYSEPLDKAIGTIKRTLATSDANSDEFLDLLKQEPSKERNGKIGQLLSEMDEFHRPQVSAAVAEFERVREERNQELANPSETYTQYKKQEEEQVRQQTEKISALIDDVIVNTEKEVEFLKPIEGNDKWNSMVEDIKTNARRAWREPISAENQAKITLAGMMAPRLLQFLDFSQKENARLNAELAEYKASTPNIQAGGGTPPVNGSKPLSAVDAFRKGVTEGNGRTK